MPVDNPRNPLDYPIWMHSAVRRAAQAPGKWQWGESFWDSVQLRKAVRRARAFRKSLKLCPGSDTAKCIPEGMEVRFRLDGLTVEVCIQKIDRVDTADVLHDLEVNLRK